MTTTTLRPYVTTGDWSPTGGGSMADDSDASYMALANSYQYGEARFDTSSIPFTTAGVMVKSLTIRTRGRTNGAVQCYVGVTAYTSLGRALITRGDSYQFPFANLFFSDYSTGQRVASLTQADGYVGVTFHPLNTVGASNQPWTSEMYLDIVYIYPPVVTLSAPTGTYTSTSAPPLTWTYFSADSLPQTAYRYLIYRDDQYGASGFVPGTTPADYDSGVIFSAVKGVNLYPRPNDTYRVYLAVAQTVNGQLQWSLWSAASALANYVIAITPPATPTVTPTADNTLAKINLAISGAGAANSVLDVYELQRSFDGGTTWEQVRSDRTGGFLENVSGARTWYDYETANGQAVVYRARTITYDTFGFTQVGAWSSTSASVSWASSSTWLKVVTRPDLNRTISIQELGEESFEVPFGTFQGLGSDQAVVISGVRRAKPDSSVVILTQTAAERTGLQSVLALGVPVLIHGSARVEDWYGDSKWLAIAGVHMSRLMRGAWGADRAMTLPYTEIDRPDPSAYLVEFGVTTWQDVDDAYASFTALSAAFSSYGAIRG